MRKIIIGSFLLVLVFALTSCSSGIDLEEGQAYWTFDEDGGLTMEMLVDSDDFEDEFDADLDDKDKEIIEDLEDSFDDQDVDAEVKSLKVKKDTVNIEIYVEDSKDIFMEIKDTLEDLADQWDMDLEDFLDGNELVYYKNEKDVDEDDIEDYEDLLYIRVSEGSDGMYYTVPGKIILVSDTLDFEKISNDTIYVDDDNGYVFFEE